MRIGGYLAMLWLYMALLRGVVLVGTVLYIETNIDRVLNALRSQYWYSAQRYKSLTRQ